MEESSTYQKLKAAYGDWMGRTEVQEATGLVRVSRNHWLVAGLPYEKRGAVQKRHVWRTKDIAKRMDERGQIKARCTKKKLCRKCQWRSKAPTIEGDCSYAGYPGHYSKSFHAQNGVPHALDAEHCAFFVAGDRVKLPSENLFPIGNGRPLRR
jgi:hypothetical protein